MTFLELSRYIQALTTHIWKLQHRSKDPPAETLWRLRKTNIHRSSIKRWLADMPNIEIISEDELRMKPQTWEG